MIVTIYRFYLIKEKDWNDEYFQSYIRNDDSDEDEDDEALKEECQILSLWYQKVTDKKNRVKYDGVDFEKYEIIRRDYVK